MTDAVREAFERIALPNFAVPTNELIEDHWQTWQEAWEEATRAALSEQPPSEPSHTTTATPQGVASTDQSGGRVRSEKD